MHSTHRLALVCLAFAVAAVGCQPEATGSAQLAVSMGQALASSASVTRVTVTSSGPGIPSVTTELTQTGTVWSGVILNIPAGAQRTFLARAFDAGNAPLFEGTASGVTITANQTSLVALTLQELNPPPPFSNEGPVIQSISATATTVQTGGSLTVQSVAQDPNVGDTLSYLWTASAGSFANPTHPSSSWTAPATAGLVTLTLAVSDNRGALSSVSLSVNVVSGTGDGTAVLDVRFNAWPSVSALTASATRLDAGQSTTVVATASDSDGDTLSYQWAATCAGSWTNASSRTASFSPSALPGGTCNNCQLTVTVSDGRGGQTRGTVGLCVTPTLATRFPPSIVRASQSSLSAQPSQTLAFEVTASDPQNSALTFSWGASGGTLGSAQSASNTSRVSWTAPACAPPTSAISITATVTNAHGLSATRAFTVTGLPACSAWAPAASMASTRYLFTTTRLANGQVLAVGGVSSTGAELASAELYTPATDTWTPTGSMPSPRANHSATLLPNGKVLVTGGGWSGPILATAVLYDPATGSWSTANPMATARYGHTATLLPSGKVLVAGGRANSLFFASAELYDPTTGAWTPTGAMAASRQDATATLLPNGKVLVAGGQGDTGTQVTAELYDPATGAWTPASYLGGPRMGAAAALLPTGEVLVTGGFGGDILAATELYNPTTNRWRWAVPMSSPRINHTMTLLSDGRVLVSGGHSGSTVLATAQVYDPTTGLWSSAGSMSAPRWWGMATLLDDGRVLVAGGSTVTMIASAELYTP